MNKKILTIEELKRLDEYKRKIESVNFEELNLKKDEKLVHCDDYISFNGKFFVPEWLISNYGRGYSLSHKKWLIPQATGTREYWHFCGTKQPAVHELVVNYFKNDSDIVALEEFGEDGVEVHHIIPIEIPEVLKFGTGENAQQRIEHCMMCNCKKNVVYQEITSDHVDDRRITHGNATLGEERGIEVWDDGLLQFRDLSGGSNAVDGNGNGAFFVYYKDENGNIKKDITMRLQTK